jgi:maltooligosyltrehalose synthase
LQNAARGNVQATAGELNSRWPDPDIKIWVTANCLAIRGEGADLFAFGEYVPLTVEGELNEHAISFARHFENEYAIVVVPRHLYRLLAHRSDKDSGSRLPVVKWADTRIIMPDDFPHEWHCKLSGRDIESRDADSKRTLGIAELLQVCPVALLKSL